MSIQVFEYTHLNISLNYSVFGSIFFLLTGFHGLHVILGIVALGLSLSLMRRGYLTVNNPLSFECAIWYWHFVDTI